MPDATVIAKKIAFAAEQPVGRADPTALIDTLRSDLIAMMTDWLGIDELDGVDLTGGWVVPDDLVWPDTLITRQGASKATRASLGVPDALALCAVARLLRIDMPADPTARETLRPFLAQTVLSLETALDGLPLLAPLSEGRKGWSIETKDDVLVLLGDAELLKLDMRFRTPDGTPVTTSLLLSADLVPAASEDGAQSGSSSAQAKRPPPRLGPCHVEIQAVADRIRMSVADCSRLELGQVVALPGLRFDHLELTVEMGDGPAPLVDAALGADKGIKAVRLNRGLDPSFRAPPPPEPDAQPVSRPDTVDA